MKPDAELEQEVRELLESETFEPEELPHILAQRGHSEQVVAAAVARVRDRIAEEQRSPAHRRALATRRRSNHLLRIGVFTLVVGLVFAVAMGWGWLQLLLVVAVGGAFLAAGYRGLRHG
ncbi:MAG: hypothetical protein JRI23_01875 [Deltaproteobacteria bacterium]|jgi:divalent metal cation (Fe/Co/Zn/Cd) transporter|nr:hypothetical protein [Deltaproteobacteria bacterium]MBW2530223.1 hypothetical protein [Deltaproteobacteria bacterium]